MFLAHRLVLAQMYRSDHLTRDHGIWWIPVVWLALLVVVVAVAAVVLLRAANRDGWTAPSPADRSARRILTERYARGELSTEELHEHMATLDEVDRGAP